MSGRRGIPDFEKLQALLAKEKYPLPYIFKFIGKNSGAFTQGLHQLETQFSKLTPKGSRESAGARHLAVTYELQALNADEIISVLMRVSQMDDLLVML